MDHQFPTHQSPSSPTPLPPISPTNTSNTESTMVQLLPSLERPGPSGDQNPTNDSDVFAHVTNLTWEDESPC